MIGLSEIFKTYREIYKKCTKVFSRLQRNYILCRPGRRLGEAPEYILAIGAYRMNLRENQEAMEYKLLSPYAAKAKQTRGREIPTEKDTLRTEFQRDRDRILHAKSFRRLMHKTQVFIAPRKDHYRTRLTHTLEVSQIARSIARGLMLNEDLIEAISLGHDLGHTPFGHIGETVLNEITPCGFKHYEQSLRVVDKLEGRNGLNLTYEVRDGILNHSGTNQASTLEGRIVKFADRIAYINHDIDDAIRAGMLSDSDLPREFIAVLGDTHKWRINNMVMDVIQNSYGRQEIQMSEKVYQAMMGLRSFMFEKVYRAPLLQELEFRARHVVSDLYEYFVSNKEKMPIEFVDMLDREPSERVVCDYIAGMTDRYALQIYEELFIPKSMG